MDVAANSLNKKINESTTKKKANRSEEVLIDVLLEYHLSKIIHVSPFTRQGAWRIQAQSYTKIEESRMYKGKWS